MYFMQEALNPKIYASGPQTPNPESGIPQNPRPHTTPQTLCSRPSTLNPKPSTAQAFHIDRRFPPWLRAVAPKSGCTLFEESKNCFPVTSTTGQKARNPKLSRDCTPWTLNTSKFRVSEPFNISGSRILSSPTLHTLDPQH